MIDTKSIISNVVGLAFIFIIYISSAESSQSLNNNFMLAQAHQYSQDKRSEHGDHGKDKGEGSKNDDKRKGNPDYAHMIIFYANVLKLNDDQLGKIVRLHLEHKQEHEQLKEKLQKSVQAFKKGSMNPNTSDDQLHKLGKDHIDVFNAMVEHHIKERRVIHAILSEDQKKQLNAIKMDHGKSDDAQDDGYQHH